MCVHFHAKESEFDCLTEHRSGDGGAARWWMGLDNRRSLLHVQPVRGRHHLQLWRLSQRYIRGFRGVQGEGGASWFVAVWILSYGWSVTNDYIFIF